MGMIGSFLNSLTQASTDPGTGVYTPSKLDTALQFLTGGQSVADSAEHLRDQHYADQMRAFQAQQLGRVLSDPNTSDDERRAILFNSPEYGKAIAGRLAPQIVDGGKTLVNAPGGGSFTAPLMGFDPTSGRGYAIGADGSTTAPSGSLGGGYEATAQGIINSTRLGPQSTFQTFQTVKPGETGGAFQPSPISIPGQAAPRAIGAPDPNAPPQPQPAGAGGQLVPQVAPAAAGAPLTVRNNNPGAIKALPNGQMWAGQTGTDQNGFAIFSSPQAGAQAAHTNLMSYATKHGINTVAGVVNRWAPAGDGSNNPQAYAASVAARMGVDPNQPLDMSDPQVQAGILGGIFHQESGAAPQLQGGAGADQLQRPVQRGQPPAAAPGGFTPLMQGKVKRMLSPQEVQAAGFAPGSAVEEAPDGTHTVVQQPQYTADWAKGVKQQFIENDAYKQHVAATAALKALTQNIGRMTGASAYSILDTFARVINPGAVAKQGTIAAIEEMLGPQAHALGFLQNLAGMGKLTPQVQQQLIDAVTPFAQAHWDEANMARNSALAQGKAAKAHGANFSDDELTNPIGARPDRAIILPNNTTVTESQARAEARQALKQNPAARAQIIGRLKQYNINAAGL